MAKLLLVLLITCLFFSTVLCWEPAVYSCKWIEKKKISIDGIIDEKEWELAKLETIDEVIIPKEANSIREIMWTPGTHLGAGTMPLNKDDFSFSWKALWDDNNLYLAIMVRDQRVIPAKLGWAWCLADSIELFFSVPDEKKFEQWYILLPYIEPIRMLPCGPPAPKGLVACNIKNDGYDVEVAIPLSVIRERFGVQIKDGALLGFDIAIDDCDYEVAPSRLCQLVWCGFANNWADPRYYGRLKFIKK